MSDIEFTDEQLRKLQEMHRVLKDASEHRLYNQMARFKPYPPQAEFLAWGATKSQRMFNAGNRLGKSETGAFEMAVHLTGRYPAWWTGRRFTKPIVGWACGKSALMTRDVSQNKLCGAPLIAGTLGTGMIPLDAFAASPTLGRGITGAYDMVQVKHSSGGISSCFFKSYEQGWDKFQGAKVDVVWLDEEPDDIKIYTESLTRTLDTRGMLYITYTPLGSVNDIWEMFSRGDDPAKQMVSMSAKQVLSYENSHLDAEALSAMVKGWLPHEVQTRLEGLPSAGAGAVFPFARSEIEWPPIYEPGGDVKLAWGLDFGGMGGTTLRFSHAFAAVLGCYDAQHDRIYILREVKLPGGNVLAHAHAMQQICADAPVFWPHDGHRTSNEDNTKDTRALYRDAGLRMWHEHATFKSGGYSTEAGVLDMHQRFGSGRLKACGNLLDWWKEFFVYSRNEKGEIIKIGDDLMSASRILTMMLPRFGQPCGMGFNRTPWKQRGNRGGSERMSSGLDYDIWNPTNDD